MKILGFSTCNGTEIRLYVHGNLGDMSTVTEVPILVNGKLTTSLIQNITSDANATIGVYYEKSRMYTGITFQVKFLV